MTYKIKPIHNEADYEAALAAVSPLFDNEPEPGTEAGDFLEVMILLIEKYEQEHYPIEAPDPVEAIKFRMEQMGLTAKDLVPAIGRQNRVYEVLNNKRALTLPMIRNLHNMFNIPLASLVGTSELR
ncbi:HTH-type transcriptional regulator/antitoxin HigA [Pantoea sp. AN62]|uniref:helix-turn-helix domain-containing protein n=1 Tax=Pantoea TaxID=53335 RepID=UPI000A215237|nr:MULTISPECIES: transcriptional regulator [Pantoea]MCQ5472821.1 transcriptional regulator [Pantoea brenneri]MDU4748665.1 transcriptional regulator [Pantoea sp.]ORM54217.1 transcriptional regulator [Pantoea brenneri]OXM18680.1 transcriptional regulator [Pantoea sp. AV62]